MTARDPHDRCIEGTRITYACLQDIWVGDPHRRIRYRFLLYHGNLCACVGLIRPMELQTEGYRLPVAKFCSRKCGTFPLATPKMERLRNFHESANLFFLVLKRHWGIQSYLLFIGLRNETVKFVKGCMAHEKACPSFFGTGLGKSRLTIPITCWW